MMMPLLVLMPLLRLMLIPMLILPWCWWWCLQVMLYVVEVIISCTVESNSFSVMLRDLSSVVWKILRAFSWRLRVLLVLVPLLPLFLLKIDADQALLRSWLETKPDVGCLALRSKSLYQHPKGGTLLQYILLQGVLDVRNWAYSALWWVEVDRRWSGLMHRCQLSLWSWRCFWWKKPRWRSIRCHVEGLHVES